MHILFNYKYLNRMRLPISMRLPRASAHTYFDILMWQPPTCVRPHANKLLANLVNNTMVTFLVVVVVASLVGCCHSPPRILFSLLLLLQIVITVDE
jgi:hypothetical protein